MTLTPPNQVVMGPYGNPAIGPFIKSSNSPLTTAPGVTLAHIFDAIADPYFLSEIIAQEIGQQVVSIEQFFPEFESRIKASPTERLMWAIGEDIIPTGKIVGTESANGFGLASVDLKISASDGQNLNGWSIGHIISNFPGRVFIVKSIATSADGFSVFTVIPADGIHNLSVVAGASLEFPDGSYFGDLGQGVDLSCYYPAVQIIQDVHYAENVITVLREEVHRDRKLMVNNWVRINAGVVDRNRSIQLYYSKQECLAFARLTVRRNNNMLWGQRNKNSASGVSQGDGIVAQIPDALKIPMMPYQISYKFLRESLAYWDGLAHDYLGKKLLVFIGDDAWYRLQEDFLNNAITKVDYRADPRSTWNSVFTDLIAGSTFHGIYDFFGRELAFVRLPGFGDPSNSGGRGLTAATKQRSIHVHDILIMDPGKKMAYDCSNGLYESSEWKISFRCLTNGDSVTAAPMVNVFRPGLVDGMGHTITSGQVLSFEGHMDRYVEENFAICLEDPCAAMFLSPTN